MNGGGLEAHGPTAAGRQRGLVAGKRRTGAAIRPEPIT